MDAHHIEPMLRVGLRESLNAEDGPHPMWVGSPAARRVAERQATRWPLRAFAAAAAVLVVAIGAAQFLPGGFGAGGATATPSPSPALLARGDFDIADGGYVVELEAFGQGSSVTGRMVVSEPVSQPGIDTVFTVQLECTRTTDDGVIMIGGVTTEGNGVAPEGTWAAIAVEPGSPVKARILSQRGGPSSEATSCMAYLDEKVPVRGPMTGLVMVEGTIELGANSAVPSEDPAATPGTTAAVASLLPTAATTAFPVKAFATLIEEPVQPDLGSKLQAALRDMPPDGGGIAATVMTPDGMWSGAAGTADGVDDLAVDSQFGIGSGTKPIIAAQVMQLVEAGEISLDAPATDYLPDDFTFDTNEATVRQLLSHRSGIPDWYPAMKEQFALDRRRVWTLDEVLALVPAARRPVGVATEYADTNYNLLGLVIEHVRQRPLAEVLRDGVLRVEGTERLIWQPDETPTEPLAMPRGESRDALDQGRGFLPSISDTVDGAAGGMASDSRSLARWWRAFCAGEIVSEASLTEMSTLYDNDYGLGLFNPAAGYAQGVGHLGANFGYSSWSGCLTPDPLIVVVLRNFEDDYIFELGRPLISAARSG